MLQVWVDKNVLSPNVQAHSYRYIDAKNGWIRVCEISDRLLTRLESAYRKKPGFRQDKNETRMLSGSGDSPCARECDEEGNTNRDEVGTRQACCFRNAKKGCFEIFLR